MKLSKEFTDAVNVEIKNVETFMRLHKQYLADDTMSAAEWDKKNIYCIDSINTAVADVERMLEMALARNTGEEVHKQVAYYYKKLKSIK